MFDSFETKNAVFAGPVTVVDLVVSICTLPLRQLRRLGQPNDEARNFFLAFYGRKRATLARMMTASQFLSCAKLVGGGLPLAMLSLAKRL